MFPLSQIVLFDMPPQPVPARLSIVTHQDIHTVVYQGRFALVSFREGDDVSKRAAAVMLAQIKIAPLAEIAQLMGWAEVTLKVILSNYRKKGVLALIKKKTGKKNPKITPEIHQEVLQAQGLTYSEIAALI